MMNVKIIYVHSDDGSNNKAILDTVISGLEKVIHSS